MIGSYVSAILGVFLSALFLVGCSDYEVRQEGPLKAMSSKLDRIETVRLEEQSQSQPVSIEQATEQVVRSLAEPNETEPAVGLTLEEVRAAALANNLDLKVELVDPAIAQQTVDAERAKFESIFVASARYTRTESSPGADPFSSRFYEAGVETPLPTGGVIAASVPVVNEAGVTEAALSVSVIQSLLQDAGTRVNTHSIRIAQYEKGIVDASTKLAAIRILGDADIAYWFLYAARKELEVRREQYKLAQDQLDHARHKVEAGSAPKIEIVRAEAGLAGRLEDVINAETAVRDRERDLKRIMNRKDMPLNLSTGILAMTDPDPCGLDLDMEALVAAAMENRMELAQLDLNLAMDEIQIDLARNDALPRLDVDYTYTTAGQSRGTGRAFENVFESGAENHTVGLSAIIPLGNRAAQARLEQARLARIRTQADQERWHQLIRQEVYQTVDDLQQNWRRILAAEQGVIAAYRDYKVEQSQFQLGARTSTDVLLAASRLADAQLRRIRALAEYEIIQVRLARATGTLLGYEQVQLQPPTPAAR
jgi:outer membrane protein